MGQILSDIGGRKMTKEEKIKLRKEIARDVIKQLRAGLFAAESTYGYITLKDKPKPREKTSQNHEIS